MRTYITAQNNSNQATSFFSDLQIAAAKATSKKQSASSLCLILDVETRWWSTHDMLERFLLLRTEVQSVLAKKYVTNIFFGEEEWQAMQDAKDALFPFYKLQKMLEGEEYVSVSMVPMFIAGIRKTLEKLTADVNNPRMVLLGGLMEAKFQERWGDGSPGTVFDERIRRGSRRTRIGIPAMVFLAACLDPRTKDLRGIPDVDRHRIIEEYLPKALEREVEVEGASYDFLCSASSTDALSDISYQPHLDHSNSGVMANFWDDFLPGNCDDDGENMVALDDSPLSIMERIKAEIRLWKNEKVLPLQLGKKGIHKAPTPLEWWKERQHSMPIMSRLARKILCIPATSASSERMFSSAAMIATHKRCCLDSINVRDSVFLNTAWKELLLFEERDRKRKKKLRTEEEDN